MVAVADQLRADGRRVHQLAVLPIASTRAVDPMIDDCSRRCLNRHGRPTIEVISNVTGQLAGDDFDQRPTGDVTSGKPCGSPTVCRSRAGGRKNDSKSAQRWPCCVDRRVVAPTLR